MSQYHDDELNRQYDEYGRKLTEKGTRKAGQAAGRAARKTAKAAGKAAKKAGKAVGKAALKLVKALLVKLIAFLGVPGLLIILAILLVGGGVYLLFEAPGATQQYSDEYMNEWSYNDEGMLEVSDDMVAPESVIIKDFYNYYSGISYYQIDGNDNTTLIGPDDENAIQDYYNSTDIFRLNPNLLYSLDTYLFEGKVKYPEQFIKPVHYNSDTLTLEPIVSEDGEVLAMSDEIDLETGEKTGEKIKSVRDYGLASVVKFNQTEDWKKTSSIKWTYHKMDVWDDELKKVVTIEIEPETHEYILPGYPEDINLVEKVISFAGEVQYNYEYRESMKEGIKPGESKDEKALVEKYLYKVHEETICEWVMDENGEQVTDQYGMPVKTCKTETYNLYKYKTSNSGAYEKLPVQTGTISTEKGLKYFYDYVDSFEAYVPSTALSEFSFSERIDYSSVAFDEESLIGETYSLPIGEALNDKSKKKKFDRAKAYFPLVQKYSYEFGINDPYILLAMMTQESGGVANINGNGLMQITSSSYTVSQTAVNRNGEKVTVSVTKPERKDPAKSIRYAAAYLKRLMDKYDGNALKAIQAYNFGEGTMARIERNRPAAWADEYAWMAYREEARLEQAPNTLSASYEYIAQRPSGYSTTIWGDSCYLEHVLQYYAGHNLEKAEMSTVWNRATGGISTSNMFVNSEEEPEEWFEFSQDVNDEAAEFILTQTKTFDEKKYYSDIESFEEVNFWEAGFMQSMGSIGIDLDSLTQLTGYYDGYAPPVILGRDIWVTSPFGMRFHPIWKENRLHKGVDVRGPIGTPIYAVAEGTIEVAKFVGGYGNYIKLNHGDGTHSRYAHLNGFAVSEGAQVVKGQLIGYMGSTGDSTGSHLHFEFHVNGAPIDPISLIEKNISEAALDKALTKIGSPYVWGATGPNAFDCSGLIKWAYGQVGYSQMKRTTRDQVKTGQIISRENVQRGDLIFFDNQGDGTTNHVGIYLGRDESGIDMMLHAPMPGKNVETRSVYWDNMTGIRRFK